jgi:acetyl-CoA carboxylase biotin carboxyl carrier protein
MVPIERGNTYRLPVRNGWGNDRPAVYIVRFVAKVEANITGTVWKIEVAVGDEITEGDVVVILESMKMEMPIESEDDGTVAEILVEEGQSVQEGDILVVLS